MSPAERSLAGIAGAVRSGKAEAGAEARAAAEAARASAAGEDGLNAFLSVLDPDDAEAAAREAAASAPGGLLAGVPVAVKDNLATLELDTTCGSRILEGWRSPFEATAVRRLRSQGAAVVGKTNMDEFAMGSSTENSAFGPTRNPVDRGRVPGGSSGGSAAAVAAGIVPAALGSDTGGSVRQPAAFCGVVGLKPTYGRVSRYGLVAFASSLDQVGTLGRSVGDAALLLQAIAGDDARDATSSKRPVPELTAAVERGVEGLTIGVPGEYFPGDLDPGVAGACRAALDALSDAGARIRDVSLPHTPYAIPTYYVVAPAEASSNLARYDGVRYGERAPGVDTTDAVYRETRSRGFGAEVKRRILLGTFVLSAGYYDAYYGRAQRVRRLIARDFSTVFGDGVDALFTPTAPTPAFGLGERAEDPYAMYLSDVFTVTANLAGIPAASVPVGRTGGLPVGGQVLGPRWREDVVLRVAGAVERGLGEAAHRDPGGRP